MSEIIKSGNLLKFSDNAFNSKWKYVYVELFRNSTFRWFEKKGDSSPKRSVMLKNVSAFLAFGDIVKQLPFKPDLKPEQVELVIAIPHENNRNTRLSFFLCSNESEIKDWVNTMLNTVTDSLPEKPASYSETNNPPPQPTNIPPGGPYGGAPTRPPCPTTGPQYPATSYGGPPAYNYPGYNQSGGAPPIGFNIGNPPVGAYPPPGNSTGAYHPPGNPAGAYPTGAYPAPGNPPVSYQTTASYAPGMPYSNYPQNPPVGPTPGYHPGMQSGNYPRPPGYASGAQPSYAPGNSYIATQPAQTYVIVDGKKKKKHRKLKNAAIGVAAGAATAYAAHKMFGGHHGWGNHGWGHGWGGGHGWGYGLGGHHHWGGSWSSLSSGSWSD